MLRLPPLRPPRPLQAQLIASNGGNAPDSANLQDNPLTPQAPAQKKTRYSATYREVQAKKATTLTGKQQEKIIAKPVPMTADEKAAAKIQNAPVDLGSNTGKKQPKPKKIKGQPKERLQEKPVDTPKPVAPTPAPTVNPALAPTSVSRGSHTCVDHAAAHDATAVIRPCFSSGNRAILVSV